MNAKLVCRIFVSVVLGLFIAASVQAQNRALDPVDRTSDWWVQRHAENVERMNQGDVGLLLVGDSITHAWDRYSELRDRFFGEYNPINLGFSGDQTQHVLWRLNNLPLDKISPKVAMIMIGTNNIGHREGTTPTETAEGIVAIVSKLKKQYPKLQIIVLKVFPRDEQPDGELRKRVNEINAVLPDLLEAALPTLPRGMEGDIRIVDINAGFLDENGILPRSIMGDFLHPGSEGYEYWGEKIAPVIREAFQRYDALPPLRDYFVMSYFIGNGESGLHLCWSADALTWHTLNDGRSFMTPTVGIHRLVRDPSIVQAPDGTFHMVWTISWTQRGIGYAYSKDLINWSDQRLIPVMESEPTTRNCWAPELFYDAPSETYYIIWASTIPDRFPGPGSEENYNHRQFYVTTKDFRTFSPTKLYFDPSHNVIDAFLAKCGDRYLLFYKDETLVPVAKKSIHLAVGPSPTGPFEPKMEIGHRNWIEGPSAIKIGDYWYVFYDHYISPQHYGAVRSRDLQTWENITDKLSFPPGIRHGTIFRVSPEIMYGLKNFRSD